MQPTVWTGLEEDFDHATGRLKKNGTYGATYITTANGATWVSRILAGCCQHLVLFNEPDGSVNREEIR